LISDDDNAEQRKNQEMVSIETEMRRTKFNNSESTAAESVQAGRSYR